jgi:segregation and condensation protein B
MHTAEELMHESEQPPPPDQLQPTLPQMPPPLAPTTTQLIESLLFVAGEPVPVGHLARALELPADTIEAALSELGRLYQHRGIRIQRHGEQVQLVSAPESAAAVARFLGVQASGRLSPAALEVLAIIAYRQPITRAQVDAIRGVDSSGTIRALLTRDLISETGRLDTVGRPILYATTPSFLQTFGLASLAELPPLALPLPAAPSTGDATTNGAPTSPGLVTLGADSPAETAQNGSSTRFPQSEAGYPHDE